MAKNVSLHPNLTYPMNTTVQSNTSWNGVQYMVPTAFQWEGWVQLLPFGDVDLPVFCSRCGQGLQRAQAAIGKTFHSPRTGALASLLMCPSFNTDVPHDAWILP